MPIRNRTFWEMMQAEYQLREQSALADELERQGLQGIRAAMKEQTNRVASR
jgi:hypothetical protein